MNTEFLDQLFLGNSIRNYMLFASILLFGLLFKRVFSRLLNRLMFILFKRLEKGTEPKVFVEMLLKPVEVLIVLFVVLGSVFNLNVATIIAGLGIGGIAVALAAQDTLQNLLGSFAIFADKPFLVGDLVRIDKFEGTIEKVGFRSTLIRTLDKTLVIIPNKKMVDSPLENLSLRNLRRMKFNIALKYDTPADAMMKISKEIETFVNEHPATSNDTLVTFDSFGDSSLNIQVLYFIEIVDYNDYMHIRQDINYQIMRIVAGNGADFAFPTQTVYHEYAVEKPADGGRAV